MYSFNFLFLIVFFFFFFFVPIVLLCSSANIKRNTSPNGDGLL